MNGKLSYGQQGHNQQESGVHLDILEERDGGPRTPQVTFPGREQQQGQPGDQRKGDDPLAQECQRVVGQVRTAQKLEERAAEDEREVHGGPGRIRTLKGIWHIHRVGSGLMGFKMRQDQQQAGINDRAADKGPIAGLPFLRELGDGGQPRWRPGPARAGRADPTPDRRPSRRVKPVPGRWRRAGHNRWGTHCAAGW